MGKAVRVLKLKRSANGEGRVEVGAAAESSHTTLTVKQGQEVLVVLDNVRYVLWDGGQYSIEEESMVGD